MIYLEGLSSVIECIYLGETLNNRSNSCDIYVNPEAIKYLTGKTIIINDIDYPEEKINTLISNGCKIISRVFIDNPDIEVRPYILKLCFDIKWNGRVLDKFITLNSIFENGLCDFDIDEYQLYFPKISVQDIKHKVKDKFNNLTALGWVLQQVGINIITDTSFCNMDIIKTGKVLLD